MKAVLAAAVIALTLGAAIPPAHAWFSGSWSTPKHCMFSIYSRC